MKKLIPIAVIAIAVYFWFDAYRALHFLRHDLTWEWQDYKLSGLGMQVARTSDTHQLLMRQVDLSNQVAIFVATTLDNRFDVMVDHQQPCTAETLYHGKQMLPHHPPQTVEFHCNETGSSLMYHHVWKKLPELTLETDDFHLKTNLATWDVSLLKKDEFRQRHAAYFNKHGHDKVQYQWSRD